jgi:hypothetical protein
MGLLLVVASLGAAVALTLAVRLRGGAPAGTGPGSPTHEPSTDAQQSVEDPDPTPQPVPPRAPRAKPWSPIDAACPGDEVARCVARYAKPKLTPEDVGRFVHGGIGQCFALYHDPEKLAAQGACLPLTLGKDARNQKSVQIRYMCSDVCPSQGTIVVRYEGVSQAECCKLGGHPQKDPAWGGYRGCAPPEVPLPRFLYRRPGRGMAQATRDPCDPSQVRFDDGTVVTDDDVVRGRQ